RYAEGLERARNLASEAAAKGDTGLEASARWALATFQLNASQYDEAAQSLRQTVLLAERSHNDELRGQALVLSVQAAFFRRHFDEALESSRLAEAVLARAGDDGGWRGRLDEFTGKVLLELGRYDEAGVRIERSRQLLEQAFGPANPRL